MILIKVEKLIIEGSKYKRTLKFTSGLNIIKGDKYSGKSLVLSLIDYAFGRQDGITSNAQRELKDNCDFVVLDLCIGNSSVTLKRDLWRNKTYIEVYFCESEKIINYAPKIINLDEFSQFMLNLLDIPELKLLKHLPHSKEYTTETLSFRDLFRYVYINQHELGTPNFMGLSIPAKKNKNKTMFEVLFGFLEFDEKNLIDQIKKKENERVYIQEQIVGLTSYLKEQQIYDREILDQNYKRLSEKILEVVTRKKSFLAAVSNREGKVEHVYAKINHHINELDETYLRWLVPKKNTEFTIFQKEALICQYRDELNEMLATKEANEILPKVEHQLNCPLCKQEVVFKDRLNVDNVFNVDEIILQLKGKIFTAEKSIDYSKMQVEKYQKDIAHIIEEQTMYVNARNEYKRSISAPYIPELEALNELNNQLSDKQATVNEGVKIFNKLDEKSSKIKKAEEDISKLKAKLQENKMGEKEKNISLDLLEKRYNGFLLAFKQRINNNTKIDRKNYLPIYDSASLLEHDSGGMLLCMHLAYLFAILYTKKGSDNFSHPGFMMFDTISKYLGTIKSNSIDESDPEKILDPEVYEKIYSDMYKIGNTFQIIAVENTPPPKLNNKAIRFTFHNGEHGLVDLSKNEKNITNNEVVRS